MDPHFDAAQVHRSGYGSVQFGADDKMITWFFDKPVLNGIKSKEAGRPVYDNVTHVHIQQPGERDFAEIPATEEHKMRFPRKWAAYQANEQQKIEGTLLAILFPNNPAVVENMKHAAIHTVEQLAALNDTQIQNIGLGGREFVNLAKQFMAHSEKGKDFNDLADKIAKLELREKEKDAKIAALEAALVEAGVDEPVKRKPGRPRAA
jgi:hypothetical protein